MDRTAKPSALGISRVLVIITIGLSAAVLVLVFIGRPPFAAARFVIVFQVFLLALICLQGLRDRAAADAPLPSGGGVAAVILTGVATLVGYSSALGLYFTADDFIHLAYSGSLEEAVSYFTFVSKKFVRPVSGVIWRLDRSLWGLEPAGYHATNLFIHFINSILVFRLARRFIPKPGPVVAAVLFCLYPLHYGAVGWVSARNDLLCATGFLLSAVATARLANRQGGLIMAVAGLVIALGSKEVSFLLPPVCIAVGLASGRKPRPLSLRMWLLFCLLATLLWLYIRLKVMGLGGYRISTPIPIPFSPPRTWLAAAFTRVPDLLMFPVSAPAPPGGKWLGGICVIAFSLVLAAMAGKRSSKPAVIIGLAWFVFCILPSLPVISIAGETVFGVARLYYVPVIGLALAAAAAIGPMRRLFAAAVMFFILILSFAGLRHNQASLEDASDRARLISGGLLEIARAAKPGESLLAFDVPAYSGDVIIFNLKGEELLRAFMPEKEDQAGLTIDLTGIPQGRIFPRESLEVFERFYMWKAGEDRFDEVTAEVRHILTRQREIEKGRALDALMIFDMERKGDLPFTNDLAAKEGGGWRTSGGDPYFAFTGIRAAPEAVASIDLEIAAGPAWPPGPRIARIFWTSEKSPEYSEDKSIHFLLTPDGNARDYSIPVRTNLPWLLSGTVTRIRIDPVDYPADLKLYRVRLKPLTER